MPVKKAAPAAKATAMSRRYRTEVMVPASPRVVKAPKSAKTSTKGKKGKMGK